MAAARTAAAALDRALAHKNLKVALQLAETIQELLSRADYLQMISEGDDT